MFKIRTLKIRNQISVRRKKEVASACVCVCVYVSVVCAGVPASIFLVRTVRIGLYDNSSRSGPDSWAVMGKSDC